MEREWIVGRLPEKDGCYEVTVKGSKGKRYVTMCNFCCNAKGTKWEHNYKVIAWRERAEPYRGIEE